MYILDYNLNIINKFLNDDNNGNFLLIKGEAGSGKSTLANYIFKDTIKLIIDSSHIKYYKNIYQHIQEIIDKKNISLMFSKQKNRSIIIDNLDIFKKYDKINYNHLLNFILENNTIKKIIITNKSANLRFKNIKYSITTNITPDILKDLDINVDRKTGWKLIEKYNNNLYKIKRNAENVISIYDYSEESEKIIIDILDKKVNIFEIDTIIDTNDTMIILSILECIIFNIPLVYNTSYIRNIYNNYVLADIFEKLYFTTNIKFIRTFILYLTCFSNIYINCSNKVYIDNKLFNMYNSKSCIICQKFYNYSIIAEILHNIYNCYINNDYKKYKFYKKEYKKYNRILKDIYNITF